MGLWNCGLSLIDFVAFCKPLWPLYMLHANVALVGLAPVVFSAMVLV